jgi:hypothetical protein
MCTVLSLSPYLSSPVAYVRIGDEGHRSEEEQDQHPLTDDRARSEYREEIRLFLS